MSWWQTALVSLSVFGSMGCGNALYAARANQASEELARAEQLDALARAPYEYHYALEHLRKARTEALEADYSAAISLAEVAFDYASRAVQQAQRVEPSGMVPGVLVPSLVVPGGMAPGAAPGIAP
jgi:hypothetical protein